MDMAGFKKGLALGFAAGLITGTALIAFNAMSTTTDDSARRASGRVKGQYDDILTKTFMNKVRFVESGGNVNAVNPKTKASGPDQFLDQTFLEQLYAHGDSIGYGHLSKHIVRTSLKDKDGNVTDPEYYIVPDKKARKRVMAAVKDPVLSESLKKAYMEKTLKTVEEKVPDLKPGIDRSVLAYKGHHFGPGGAVKIAEALTHTPRKPFVSVVGESACESNPRICYRDKDGKPRTVQQVYVLLERKLEQAPSEFNLK